MLRYLLLKLPSFTSKTDFPVSPPCNKTSILRPTSPVKRDYRREPKRDDEAIRPVHKRSYSFPSTRSRGSHLFAESHYNKWDKCELAESQDRDTQRNEVHQGSRRNRNKTQKQLNPENEELYQNYNTNQTKRLEGEKFINYNEMNKSEDFCQSFEAKERYELEAARPKRNRSELFNVFDYVTKNGNESVRYLQPNKLRPFGSNDNIYLPLLMNTRTLELDHFPPDISTHSFKDSGTLRKDKQNIDGVQRRHFSTLNKGNKSKYCTKEIKLANSAMEKDKEVSPLYISKKLSPKDETTDTKEVLDKKKSSENISCNRTLEETLIGNPDKQSTEDIFHSYRLSWNEPGIKIEPTPFLQNDDITMNLLASDKPKKSPSESMRLRAPWPAYSESIKMNNEQKCSSESNLVKENLQHKILLPPKRSISTGNIKRVEGKVGTKQLYKQTEKLTRDFSHRKALRFKNLTESDTKLENKQLHQEIEILATDPSQKQSVPTESVSEPDENLEDKHDFPQKRSLSSEHIKPHLSVQNVSKRCRSSTAVSNTKVTSPHLGSLNTKVSNVNLRKNYARSSKSSKPRPFEPESCAKEEKPPKYFLPSKVRLKPPECSQRPDYGCKKEDPCPPRADQCLKIAPRKLPILKAKPCPCIEPYVPTSEPKVRRLRFKFVDPPRICPCNPCPCPPRADDFLTPKPKKLSPYTPGHCACIEPPPMVDVPLVKLKKICEPEAKCYPPKPCPKADPCIRADDTRVDCPKKLPVLRTSDCPCIEPYVPNVSPQLRRLKMEFNDPTRICPCEPRCPCPPRADDFLKEKQKKLPVYKPGHCECIEPPQMVDVPLIRLKKICPKEVCDPQKFCPVERCEDKPRADDTLKVKIKKLPVLEVTNYCKCVEPEIPDKNPKLRRLTMKRSELRDSPRICPCEPNCPCPPRADDTLVPKRKKLLPLVPGFCKCIEPPPLVDVPLLPLKKLCEPEAKCYPPKPCPKEPPCVRADDTLCTPPKKLRPLEAKDCPCIENPKLTEAPKLKRLGLHFPEPPKACPIPPPCIRADDSLKDKIRRLPVLPPGACPCVDTKPPEDVKPLKRLKCENEEIEPVCEDPCVPYPRADWGCWEYTQSIDPDKDKKCKKGKKGTVNYDTKRKFNTDSRANLYKSMSNTEQYNHVDATVSLKEVKLSNIHKVRDKTSSDKKEVEGLPEKLFKFFVRKSKSLPTLRLLKQLNECEISHNKKRPETSQVRVMDIKSVLNKLSTRATLQHQPFMNNNIRRLCTSAVRQTDNAKRPVSTGTILFSPGKKDSKKSKGKDDIIKNKKNCPKGTCPKMILKGCAQKSLQGCEKERMPVCCEKKSPPYPAFSEAMDDEVEPYSKTSQWTCNRKMYGFDPNPKKADEPLDTVKNKKKFSTSTYVSEYERPNADRLRNLHDGAILKPKTHTGVRELSTLNTPSSRQTNRQKIESSINTAHIPLRFERSNLVQQVYRDASTVTINGVRNKQNSSYDIIHSSSAANRMNNKSRFKTEDYHMSQDNKFLQCRRGIQNTTKLNCGSISRRGYSTLQPNNSSVLCPITTEGIPQNIVLLNNLSSATTNTIKPTARPEFHNQILRSKSNFESKQKKGDKKCKKKPCQKFQMNNFPPKERETCKTHRPVICKKPKAPYPAFTDCMDDEMQENISECPLVKERLLRLQPKHMNTLPKLDILPPVKPNQGRIDKQKEEDCIRQKLCMKNEGVTQCCSEFGKFVKPMRSKDYIKKEKNRDCERIEELKKEGRWPPKNTKGFCTRTSGYFDMQKRDLSTLPNTYCISGCILDANTDELTKSELYKSDKFESNPVTAFRDREDEESTSQNSRRMYVRNYDALFNPENKISEDMNSRSAEIFQNKFKDSSESCKYVKLRNIQWRIDNFQKWCKLNKLSNLPTPIKRFHTCSKIRYKRYVKCNDPNYFSTSPVKCTSANENSDLLCTQRGISTTMMLAKSKGEYEISNSSRKPNKFSIVSKGHRSAKKCPKFRLSNCPPRERMTCERKRVDRPCTKPVPPNPAFSECYDEDIIQPVSECPIEKERYQRLQPKYPLLPEIGTISLPPPHQGRIDRSLEEDYIRLKLGIENEGLTQDCQTFGEPVKVLRCKDYTNYEYMSRGKSDQCLMHRRGRESNIERPRNPCKCPKQPCPNIRPIKCDKSLWQRIVNYFKARPNCPGPDEWKKRALREKAEKAARAAGLCLCDPRDLPKKLCPEDLPKVITPRNSCPGIGDDSCDGGGSGKKCKKASSYSPKYRCGSTRRCVSTTPRRCYSNNVGWKNLEEINKTIEEEEKKKLAKKMSRSYSDDDINLLNDPNYSDDDLNYMHNTVYEDIFSEAILNKNEENDITKYVEVDDQDSSINYAFQIVPNENNLVEIIFNEPVDELTNYTQAKAFAAFQDYFNNIDTFSDVSYEDMEKNKTNNLLKELNKLLEDKEESNQEN